MSFTLFLERFRDGEPAPFPRQVFDRIFSPSVVDDPNIGTTLRYPDDGGGELSIADGDAVTGFTIDRPAGDLLFVDIITVMREVGAVLFWPDEGPCSAVTDPSVVAHLPPDMTEALGPPHVVATATDLMIAISGTPQPPK
jgi:hypothetical protein